MESLFKFKGLETTHYCFLINSSKRLQEVREEPDLVASIWQPLIAVGSLLLSETLPALPPPSEFLWGCGQAYGHFISDYITKEKASFSASTLVLELRLPSCLRLPTPNYKYGPSCPVDSCLKENHGSHKYLSLFNSQTVNRACVLVFRPPRPE